jgi:hypothetical protein
LHFFEPRARLSDHQLLCQLGLNTNGRYHHFNGINSTKMAADTGLFLNI